MKNFGVEFKLLNVKFTLLGYPMPAVIGAIAASSPEHSIAHRDR